MDSFNRDPFADDPGPGAIQRPRNRDSLFLMARLTFVGTTDVRKVRVRNLSEGGMMAEVDRIVDAGTPVLLDLRGIGEVPGKAAWCTEGRIGIAFDRKIDPRKARKPVGQGAKASGSTKPAGHGPRHRGGGKDPAY